MKLIYKICIYLIILLMFNSCESFKNYINLFSDDGTPVNDANLAKKRPTKEKNKVTEAPEQEQQVRQTSAQESNTTRSGSSQTSTAARNITESKDGLLRLILNEKTGSFSIFYITDPQTRAYIPLFSTKNPRTSYLSLSVNKKIHRLGKSKKFSTRVGKHNGNPAFIFESEALKVTQSFTPVKTTDANSANGIMITVTIENKGGNEELMSVGLRMLIDTELGEEKGFNHFVTDNRIITNEMQIRGASGEKYWVSRGNFVSLMGSIVNPENPNATPPDYVHFANWKRLNETPWTLRYFEGRSFSNLPFSLNDSAVCYYYEPVSIENGNSVVYSIYLTTEDASWYYPADIAQTNSTNSSFQNNTYSQSVPQQVTYTNASAVQVSPSVSIARETSLQNFDHNPVDMYHASQILNQSAAVENNASYSLMDSDRAALERMQELLNQFVEGKINLSDHELSEIERVINSYRN